MIMPLVKLYQDYFSQVQLFIEHMFVWLGILFSVKMKKKKKCLHSTSVMILKYTCRNSCYRNQTRKRPESSIMNMQGDVHSEEKS